MLTCCVPDSSVKNVWILCCVEWTDLVLTVRTQSLYVCESSNKKKAQPNNLKDGLKVISITTYSILSIWLVNFVVAFYTLNIVYQSKFHIQMRNVVLHFVAKVCLLTMRKPSNIYQRKKHVKRVLLECTQCFSNCAGCFNFRFNYFSQVFSTWLISSKHFSINVSHSYNALSVSQVSL
jgi:hypothetical protein